MPSADPAPLGGATVSRLVTRRAISTVEVVLTLVGGCLPDIRVELAHVLDRLTQVSGLVARLPGGGLSALVS